LGSLARQDEIIKLFHLHLTMVLEPIGHDPASNVIVPQQ
jgi:hypothetical protein